MPLSGKQHLCQKRCLLPEHSRKIFSRSSLVYFPSPITASENETIMIGLTSPSEKAMAWFSTLWLEWGSHPQYMCLSGIWIKEFCYQNEERMTVNGVSHNTFNFFFNLCQYPQKSCTCDKLPGISFFNFRKDLCPQHWVINTEFSVTNTFWQYLIIDLI